MDDEFTAHSARRRVEDWRVNGLAEIIAAIKTTSDAGETVLRWSTENLNNIDAVIRDLRGRYFNVRYDKSSQQIVIVW